jgi:hypothetical protein
MTERSEPTLRHSIFDILRFCGSLLTWCSFTQAAPLAKKTASLIGKETLILFVQPQRLQGTKIEIYIIPLCLRAWQNCNFECSFIQGFSISFS